MKTFCHFRKKVLSLTVTFIIHYFTLDCIHYSNIGLMLIVYGAALPATTRKWTHCMRGQKFIELKMQNVNKIN